MFTNKKREESSLQSVERDIYHNSEFEENRNERQMSHVSDYQSYRDMTNQSMTCDVIGKKIFRILFCTTSLIRNLLTLHDG
jgi:hypothetical protein